MDLSLFLSVGLLSFDRLLSSTRSWTFVDSVPRTRYCTTYITHKRKVQIAIASPHLSSVWHPAEDIVGLPPELVCLNEMLREFHFGPDRGGLNLLLSKGMVTYPSERVSSRSSPSPAPPRYKPDFIGLGLSFSNAGFATPWFGRHLMYPRLYTGSASFPGPLYNSSLTKFCCPSSKFYTHQVF
jgi:hypothetical protein